MNPKSMGKLIPAFILFTIPVWLATTNISESERTVFYLSNIQQASSIVSDTLKQEGWSGIDVFQNEGNTSERETTILSDRMSRIIFVADLVKIKIYPMENRPEIVAIKVQTNCRWKSSEKTMNDIFYRVNRQLKEVR